MYLFFFFKQKTAYETRISDWSSDVCSSDLFEPVFGDLGSKMLDQERSQWFDRGPLEIARSFHPDHIVHPREPNPYRSPQICLGEVAEILRVVDLPIKAGVRFAIHCTLHLVTGVK